MRTREAKRITSGLGLAAILRQQRKLLRLTLKGMGERTRIPAGRLSEYETAVRRFPSAKTLAALATGYEIPRPLVLGLHFARRLRAVEQRLGRLRENLVDALVFGDAG